MPRYYLDTNVLLRYLLQDHMAQFQKVEDLFALADKGEIELVVEREIFFELDFVLRRLYQLTRREVAEFLQSILDTRFLMIPDRELLYESAQAFRKDTKLDYVDRLLMTLAKRNRAEVFSFDKAIVS